MDNIVVSYISSSSPKYAQVWHLREEILRKPIGLSLKNEDLAQDHKDFIFIAEYDNSIIACLMLHRLNENDVKLRQMAVYSEWQGKGIGKLLVEAAEEYAFQSGYKSIVLHARKEAVGFYRSLRYSVVGNGFTEVGIPHFFMRKEISPQQ